MSHPATAISRRTLGRPGGRIAAALLIAAFLAPVGAMANTTWYFTGGNDTQNGGITTPSKWADANGTVATAFSTEDTYVVRNGRLRIKGKSFEGGPIHFGDFSQTGAMRRGGVCHDDVSKTTGFPNGAYFDCGYYWLNCYSTALTQQRVAILEGGWINVRSPLDAPFVFYCNNANGYNIRHLFIKAPLSSDANAGVVFGPAVSAGGNYTTCGTNFMVSLWGDCPDYLGTISVTTAQHVAEGWWDARLAVDDITIGGRVRMAPGTAITASHYSTGSTTFTVGASSTPTECTIGSLELAARSMILVGGNTTTPTNGIIHVRNELSVEKPVTVKLSYAAATPGLTPVRLTILTAPSSSRLDASDFKLDIGSTSAAQYYDLVVEEDEATQMKSLVAVFGPTVWQTNQYGNEGNKDRTPGNSSFTNAAYWSDGQLPHGGAHYYSGNHYLRTIVDQELDYDFPGLSFTQDRGRFTILTKSFRVPTYRTRGYTTIWLGQHGDMEKTIRAARFVAESGTVDLGAYNNQTLVIDGEIVGAANFTLRGVTTTSATKGNYRFSGLNTNFTGNITVEQQTVGDYLTFGFKFQTLFVNDGRNLGGAKEAFDAKALKLATMSRLSVTNGTVTLPAGLNRGIYIESGRLFTAADCTLAVDWPITMHGKLWKEGAGTLVLGGDVRFDSANGEPEASSNLFEIVAGTVKVKSYNAIDGLETTFDNGTSLVLAIDPSDANLTKYGIMNAKTQTPFRLGSGLSELPLVIDTSAYPVVENEPQTFGILTVADNAETLAATRAMLPRLKPYRDIHNSIVERENVGEGTVTFALRLEQIGTVIIVR